jgi:hypothetical protein
MRAHMIMRCVQRSLLLIVSAFLRLSDSVQQSCDARCIRIIAFAGRLGSQRACRVAVALRSVFEAAQLGVIEPELKSDRFAGSKLYVGCASGALYVYSLNTQDVPATGEMLLLELLDLSVRAELRCIDIVVQQPEKGSSSNSARRASSNWLSLRS